MKSLFLFISIIFCSLYSQADDCVSQADADKFLADYSVLFFNDSNQKWEKKTSIPLCANDDFSYSLLRGFVFLNNVQSSSPTKSTTSVISQEGAENYFKKRISSLLIETNKHSKHCATEGAVAYVADIEGPNMHICPDGFKGFSPLMASYVMLHEARHMDGYDHVFCSQGPLKAQDEEEGNYYGSCDESYEQQGSYGIGAGYLLEVYHTTTDPVTKQEARSSAVVDLLERFNKLPLDMKTGVLIQSDKDQFSFYDGKSTRNILTFPGTLQTATLRYGLPTFFDIDGKVMTYLYSEKWTPTESAFADYYRKDFSPEKRAATLDVYYSSEYSCFLFSSSLHCEDDKNLQFEMSFQSIKPIQFIKTSSTLLSNEILYISASDGYLYALPNNMAELQEIAKEEDLKKSSHAYNLLSLSPGFDQDELGISTSGELLSYTPKTKNWAAVPAYKRQKNKKILSPFVWSKKLEEL